MIEIRQSLVRRGLVQGVPPGLAMMEVMILVVVNMAGGLSVRKLIFSFIVGVVGHGLWVLLYARDSYFLEALLANTRYGLIYSGGAKDGGMER